MCGNMLQNEEADQQILLEYIFKASLSFLLSEPCCDDTSDQYLRRTRGYVLLKQRRMTFDSNSVLAF